MSLFRFVEQSKTRSFCPGCHWFRQVLDCVRPLAFPLRPSMVPVEERTDLSRCRRDKSIVLDRDHRVVL